MSLHLPSRRVVRATANSQANLSNLLSHHQRRTIFGWFKSNKDQDLTKRSAPKNPLTAEYLTKKPSAQSGPALIRGDLAESSIFEDEELAGPKPKGAIVDPQGRKVSTARNPESMAAALDPDPQSRKRWERKMVIREIQKRGRLSRAQQLKKEERELLSKSHDFKTSVKKLVPLAKQISGKTVDEAITQMRFSKKKAAKDVKDHLEHAKNEAIVKRGMGLGLDGKPFNSVKIQTKDGKRVKVTDPTTLYVSQAWCGKGLSGTLYDFRARGNIHFMDAPTTSLSLVIKEEATRIRLHEDKEKKLQNRKVWVQLPNRPVTSQRQHYSW